MTQQRIELEGLAASPGDPSRGERDFEISRERVGRLVTAMSRTYQVNIETKALTRYNAWARKQGLPGIGGM